MVGFVTNFKSCTKKNKFQFFQEPNVFGKSPCTSRRSIGYCSRELRGSCPLLPGCAVECVQRRSVRALVILCVNEWHLCS